MTVTHSFERVADGDVSDSYSFSYGVAGVGSETFRQGRH